MTDSTGHGRNTTTRQEGLSYRDAGVDISAADSVVHGIREMQSTRDNPRIIGGLGHFGGFYRLGASAPGTTLVASIDGVGTKVLVAQQANRHDSLGEDLVHHCVNDILACGAEPLFFLDYFGTGKLNPVTALSVISGMSRACARLGIALLGGETAEMPGLYQSEDFDLVGAIVGIVQEDRIVDGSLVTDGDVVLGLPSNGFHTNGYSLIRAALRLNESVAAREMLLSAAPFDPSQTLADVLLRPHRSYRVEVTRMIATGKAKAMAHITGGGLPGNVSRVIPDGLAAIVDLDSWTVPPMFEFVAEAGHVARDECFTSFNMGIGYVVVCGSDSVDEIQAAATEAIVIGRVVSVDGGPKVRLRSSGE